MLCVGARAKEAQMDQLKKISKIIGALALVAIVSIQGLKLYNAKKGLELVDKCFIIKQELTAFTVVAYQQGRFYQPTGSYLIEGVVFVIPFKAVVDQDKFENTLLPIAEEMDCKTGKTIVEEN